MSDESTRAPGPHPDLYTALSIGIGSVLTVACMAYHPTAGSHEMEALVAEMSAKVQVSAVVHGALIAIIYYFYMYPVEARQAEEEA